MSTGWAVVDDMTQTNITETTLHLLEFCFDGFRFKAQYQSLCIVCEMNREHCVLPATIAYYFASFDAMLCERAIFLHNVKMYFLVSKPNERERSKCNGEMAMVLCVRVVSCLFYCDSIQRRINNSRDSLHRELYPCQWYNNTNPPRHNS